MAGGARGAAGIALLQGRETLAGRSRRARGTEPASRAPEGERWAGREGAKSSERSFRLLLAIRSNRAIMYLDTVAKYPCSLRLVTITLRGPSARTLRWFQWVGFCFCFFIKLYI